MPVIPVQVNGEPARTTMIDFNMLPMGGDWVDVPLVGPCKITGRFFQLVEVEVPRDPTNGIINIGRTTQKMHALFLIAHTQEALATMEADQAAAREAAARAESFSGEA